MKPTNILTNSQGGMTSALVRHLLNLWQPEARRLEEAIANWLVMVVCPFSKTNCRPSAVPAEKAMSLDDTFETQEWDVKYHSEIKTPPK